MRERIMRAAARPTNKAPAANFTGLVCTKKYSSGGAVAAARLARVLHAGRADQLAHACRRPGALTVLTGVGRSRRWAGKCRCCSRRHGRHPAGVKHWHGAAPDHMNGPPRHVRVERKGRSTTWLEPSGCGTT